MKKNHTKYTCVLLSYCKVNTLVAAIPHSRKRTWPATQTLPHVPCPKTKLFPLPKGNQCPDFSRDLLFIFSVFTTQMRNSRYYSFVLLID